MTGGLYSLIALAMRYFFAAIMLLIALRAWKITLVDSRRARALRRYAPETGVSGQLLVVEGDGRARKGMRYTVIREGLIGSARRADVRVRSHTVRRAHALFEVSEKGMEIRTMGAAQVYDRHGVARHKLLLGDGGRFSVGAVEMIAILSGAVGDEVYNPVDGEDEDKTAPRDSFDEFLENPRKASRNNGFDEFLENPRAATKDDGFDEFLENPRAATKDDGFDEFLENPRAATKDDGIDEFLENPRAATENDGFDEFFEREARPSPRKNRNEIARARRRTPEDGDFDINQRPSQRKNSFEGPRGPRKATESAGFDIVREDPRGTPKTDAFDAWLDDDDEIPRRRAEKRRDDLFGVDEDDI